MITASTSYEQARKEKEAKKKQRTIDIKEVRLSPNIEDERPEYKGGTLQGSSFQKGDKVKVTLRFRGREMAHVQEDKADSRRILRRRWQMSL